MCKIKQISTGLVFLLFSHLLMANEAEINLNVEGTVLAVNVSNQQRGHVLKQIAKKMNHTLQGLESLDQSTTVSFDISGPINKVLNQLVSPASVIIASYADDKKLKEGVAGVIWILPLGEESKHKNGNIAGAELTINPKKNRRKFKSSNMSEDEWKAFKKQRELKGDGVAEAERAGIILDN